ncbi:flavin reductase family protein [Streptomyces sp. NPDC091272]|uniref:flavin reductase family protein n=1 Tax=Streptomyces sp. NPDC091272 TaxID=3365981 RepID=UPI0038018883
MTEPTTRTPQPTTEPTTRDAGPADRATTAVAATDPATAVVAAATELTERALEVAAELTERASDLPADATPSSFRTMMSGFPTGVCVVTAFDGTGAPRGMTCSSVCSVSLEPPTLLVCLRRGSPTLDAVLEAGRFTVNLLHEGAQDTAELFASGNPDRFLMTSWEGEPRTGGPQLVKDAHTVADCDVVLTQRMGDHVTVFGAARRISTGQAQPPLLYGLRQFRAWSAV